MEGVGGGERERERGRERERAARTNAKLCKIIRVVDQ